MELNIPLKASLVEGHPRIEEVRNLVAIKQGPVVHCLESTDNPRETKTLDGDLKAKGPQDTKYRLK